MRATRTTNKVTVSVKDYFYYRQSLADGVYSAPGYPIACAGRAATPHRSAISAYVSLSDVLGPPSHRLRRVRAVSRRPISRAERAGDRSTVAEHGVLQSLVRRENLIMSPDVLECRRVDLQFDRHHVYGAGCVSPDPAHAQRERNSGVLRHRRTLVGAANRRVARVSP